MRNGNKKHQPSVGDNHSNSDKIAQRAYELYEARGGEAGHELEDWLQAEREITQRGEVAHSG